MSTRLEAIGNSVHDDGRVRLELERCRRELEASRKRVGELEYGEKLLAGENRLLGMIAGGSPLGEILATVCRLIEELSPGAVACLVSILRLHWRWRTLA